MNSKDVAPDDAETAKPGDAEGRGIECPRCGCGHFSVIETRRTYGQRILRRRECRNCGRKIMTIERLA